jgi:hypothetical protein
VAYTVDVGFAHLPSLVSRRTFMTSSLLFFAALALPHQIPDGALQLRTPWYKKEMRQAYQDLTLERGNIASNVAATMKMYEKARDRGDPLGVRLALLGDAVFLVDDACRQALPTLGRFTGAYRHAPDEHLRESILREYGQLYKERAGYRFAFCIVFMGHRWFGEPDKVTPVIYRYFLLLARLCGMQNDLERFLKGFCHAQMFISDVSPLLFCCLSQGPTGIANSGRYAVDLVPFLLYVSQAPLPKKGK